MPKIDGNSQNALLAVEDTANGNVVDCLVDPTTGELLIVVVGDGSPTPSTALRVDGNTENVAFGVSDVDADELLPLLCDTNGYLYVDLIT